MSTYAYEEKLFIEIVFVELSAGINYPPNIRAEGNTNQHIHCYSVVTLCKKCVFFRFSNKSKSGWQLNPNDLNE